MDWAHAGPAEADVESHAKYSVEEKVSGPSKGEPDASNATIRVFDVVTDTSKVLLISLDSKRINRTSLAMKASTQLWL